MDPNSEGRGPQVLEWARCDFNRSFEDRRGGDPPRGVRLVPFRLCRRTSEVKAYCLVSGRPVSGRRLLVGHPQALSCATRPEGKLRKSISLVRTGSTSPGVF
jgi:hypothetical protein